MCPPPEPSQEVEVPEGCCQISGDDVEGFILTWWGDTHENG